MGKEKLPVGTVIRDKEDKLYIIMGYNNESIEYHLEKYDYVVESYPFSLMNMLASKIQKEWKKYSEYPGFCQKSHIEEDEIKEIIFYGYKDENFVSI